MLIKKIIATVLMLAITLSTLAGCDIVNNDVEQTNYSLTIYAYTKDDMGYYKRLSKKYNESYPNVKVDIKDYISMDSLSAATHLSSAMMAGNGPDVVMMAPNMFYFHDVEKMMRNDAFADLTPFLQADKSYNAEDYYEQAIKGGQLGDKQYIMPLSISIPTLLSSKELIDKSGIKLEECTSYLKFAEQIDSYIQKTKDDAEAPRAFSSSGALMQYANYLGIDIVDYEKQTIDLSSHDLKIASEYYKNLYPQEITFDGKEEQVQWNDDIYKPVLRKDAIFTLFSTSQITHSTIINGMTQLYLNGQDAVIAPLLDENGKLGATVTSSIAINNKSANKQNAYNFLRMFLDEEVQDFLDAPIRKESLRLTELNARRNADSDIYKTPEGYFDDYYALFEQLDYVYIPSNAGTIFWEEMLPYYEDEKTYDECKESAQSKLEIYISE